MKQEGRVSGFSIEKAGLETVYNKVMYYDHSLQLRKGFTSETQTNRDTNFDDQKIDDSEVDNDEI